MVAVKNLPSWYRRFVSSGWIACCFGCLLFFGRSIVVGQTPWETIPAKPAQPPPNSSASSLVEPLPAPGTVPPQSSPITGSGAVSMPAHIPIGGPRHGFPSGVNPVQPPSPKSSGTETVRGSQTPARPSAVSSEKPSSTAAGLIPDSFALPKQVSQGGIASPTQPAQQSGAFNLPLPPLDFFEGPDTRKSASTPSGPTVPVPGASPNVLSAPEVLSAPGRTMNPTTRARSPEAVNRPPGKLASIRTTPILETRTYKPGKRIAVVGTQSILAGDMAVFIEPIIEKNRDKLRSPADEEKVRSQLTRQALGQYIEVKALYQEFFRDMIGTAPPDEIEEMTEKVTTKASKIFFEQQVPNLLKKYQASDLASLEQKLRENSMSVRQLQSQFVEQVLSSELERKYIPETFDISRDELLEYYREHESDWQTPAKARWRQLTIRFDKHNHDRAVVDTLIKQLGDQIFLGGKPFEAVAREASEGFTASQGGEYDWTSQGSLKSKPLDQAIFSLQPGYLSRVIVDDVGMHIIEVLERTPASTTSFADAQPKIREEITRQKRIEEIKKFRRKVLSRTPIWSLWPEDLKEKAPHARPLSEAIGSDDE